MKLGKNLEEGGKESSPFVDIIFDEVRLEFRKEICLGWSSHLVEDHLSILTCYKCWGFGHMSKHCREKEEMCGRCGKKGHRRQDCEANTPMCDKYNISKNKTILNTDHEVFSNFDSSLENQLKGCEKLETINYG
uniref:CCHC-type domain-containing protein n=1 Tax=Photinus pyralis TaxID=7054 RepID=A0A1Y1L202_PHOPY